MNRFVPSRWQAAIVYAALLATAVRADHVLVSEPTKGNWVLKTVSGLQINDKGTVVVLPPQFRADTPIHLSYYRTLKPMPLEGAPVIVAGVERQAMLADGALLVPAGLQLLRPGLAPDLWRATWLSHLFSSHGPPQCAAR